MTTTTTTRPRKGSNIKSTRIGLERNFDIPFIAEMALREKQIQQNYRPIISVHKWFARRPGTLFRGLLLSEFNNAPLRETYFKANDLSAIKIADPFMGGGTPLIEANRLGCDVTGFDINPMAYWIVREEIEHLDIANYQQEALKLTTWVKNKIGSLYTTRCLCCGRGNADVKYFLWVKTLPCQKCGTENNLFPGYRIAEARRHPKNVFVCPHCGELTESSSAQCICKYCSKSIPERGLSRSGTFECSKCGTANKYPKPELGAPKHKMFALEYYCEDCKTTHAGRFFKKPDNQDIAKYSEAQSILRKIDLSIIPDDIIPAGDETNRLHRWGYKQYKDMFNERQLLGLALSCQALLNVKNERIQNALATNLSDLLRYQNMLCRYDTMALKSLDIFSVHGFPVGLVQCESNLLGIANKRTGSSIGSGGWTNIIEKYSKAKAYCDLPFETQITDGNERRINIADEWIGENRSSDPNAKTRKVSLQCKSSTIAQLQPKSLDAVFTDPPYYENVQYAELMDFCYVWLKRLVQKRFPAFNPKSTRNANELTGNVTMDRGIEHFTEGIAEVFSKMAKALKPGGPFAFTYHHNRLEAYYPIAVAILDSGLTCSASIPCPGEMGGSIHINGTGSSIIDTIFVSRSTGSVPKRCLVESAQGIAGLVLEDALKLRAGNIAPTQGDLKCIIYGHLIRMAIWNLKKTWTTTTSTKEKLQKIEQAVRKFGSLESIEKSIGSGWQNAAKLQNFIACEKGAQYKTNEKSISF